MDTLALRKYAELLDLEIDRNRNGNPDVEWLANNMDVRTAIDDAKNGRINFPRELGLNRWVFESSIQDVPEVMERLSQFSILLRGMPLPAGQ